MLIIALTHVQNAILLEHYSFRQPIVNRLSSSLSTFKNKHLFIATLPSDERLQYNIPAVPPELTSKRKVCITSNALKRDYSSWAILV